MSSFDWQTKSEKICQLFGHGVTIFPHSQQILLSTFQTLECELLHLNIEGKIKRHEETGPFYGSS